MNYLYRPKFDPDKYKKPSPFYGFSHDQYLISSNQKADTKKNVNNFSKSIISKNSSNFAFESEEIKQSDKKLKRLLSYLIKLV